MHDRVMNRRRFIAIVASITASTALAACTAPPTPPPSAPRRDDAKPDGEDQTAQKPSASPASQAAPAGSGEVVVNYITELWNWQKLNMATATDAYNQTNRGKVRVQVDPSPDGWQTKVVQMLQGGDLLWEGMLRVNSLQGFPYYQLGLMQPVEPFIKSSSVAWAAQFFDQLLPSVRESFTLENQLYYLPWDTEVFVRHYMVEQWEQLGGKPAETLEDYEKQLLEYKKAFPGKTPLGLAHSTAVHAGDYQMFAQLWQENPWKQDGDTYVPDVRGDGYRQYLDLMKKWYSQSIITDDSWGQAQTDWKWTEPWLKQEIGSLMTGAAWGFTQARQIYGQKAVEAVPIPKLNNDSQPKTFLFSNSASVFKQAKHPQEVVDWLLWMVDPTNTKPGAETFTFGYLNYYHLPAYKMTYEQVVGTNPQWQWIEAMLPMVQVSKPIPIQTFVTMWRDIMVPWNEKYVRGTASFEEVAQGIETEGKAALENVLKQN